MFNELSALLLTAALTTTPVHPERVVTVEITPKATITQVCLPKSCSSSWVPHETDASATGNEPQEFLIPAEDQKK